MAVQAGQAVAKGDLLLVLEAMKMEFRLQAPVAGTVDAVLQFGVPWPTPWMSRSCSPTSRACPPTEPEKRPDRQSDWKQNPTRDVEQPGSSHGSIPVRSLVQLQPSQPF